MTIEDKGTTARTDAFASLPASDGLDKLFFSGDDEQRVQIQETLFAWAEFARQLERELQAAEAQLEELKENNIGVCAAWKRDYDGAVERGNLWRKDCEAAQAQLAEAQELWVMREAAISAASFANTADGRSERLPQGHPYWSAGLQDVYTTVDREIRERERAEAAEAKLAQVERENFKLAAGVCQQVIGDESGTPICKLALMAREALEEPSDILLEMLTDIYSRHLSTANRGYAQHEEGMRDVLKALSADLFALSAQKEQEGRG